MNGSRVTFTAYVHDDEWLDILMLLVRMIEDNQLSKGVCIKIRSIKNVDSAIRRRKRLAELGDERSRILSALWHKAAQLN
jgi:hypothetical protein